MLHGYRRGRAVRTASFDSSFGTSTPLPLPLLCSATATKIGPILTAPHSSSSGPVLGPMVYGAAYSPIDKDKSLRALGEWFQIAKACATSIP